MSEYDCYRDSHGCWVCPEVPAITGHAAYYTQQAVIGWNAGANSITELDGDLHVTFVQPVSATGVVLGLRGGRARNTLPALVEHGFYFQSVGNFSQWQVIESGQTRTPAVARSPGDQFEIRRVADRVTFLVNGAMVYASTVRSHGPKVVNCCLYTSGDTAPAGDPG